MNFVDRCNELCRAVCREQFPGVEIEPDFHPNLDLTYGDISSKLIQKLAALLRIAPEEAARRLMPAILQTVPDAVVTDHFINMRYPREDLIEESLFHTRDVAADEGRRPFSIVVPPPHGEIHSWPYVRLAAAAVWQTAFLRALGREAELIVQGSDGAGDSLCEQFRVVLQTAFERSRRVQTSAAAGLADVLNKTAEGRRVHAWLSTRSLAKRELHTLLDEHPDRLKVYFPDMDWFVPWEDDADHAAIAGWNDTELRALLFYLLRPLSAAELDLAVPKLAENANTLHFARTSVERLDRLFSEAPREVGPGREEFEPFDVMRGLLLRRRFLGRFLELAAYEGDVRDFFFQLQDLLSRLNSTLNSPPFRLRLAQGDMSANEYDFVTGTRNRLSDMINIRL